MDVRKVRSSLTLHVHYGHGANDYYIVEVQTWLAKGTNDLRSPGKELNEMKIWTHNWMLVDESETCEWVKRDVDEYLRDKSMDGITGELHLPKIPLGV